MKIVIRCSQCIAIAMCLFVTTVVSSGKEKRLQQASTLTQFLERVPAVPAPRVGVRSKTPSPRAGALVEVDRHVSWDSVSVGAHAASEKSSAKIKLRKRFGSEVAEDEEHGEGEVESPVAAPTHAEVPRKRVRSGFASDLEEYPGPVSSALVAVGAPDLAGACVGAASDDGRARSPSGVRRRGGSFSIAAGEDEDPYAMEALDTRYLLAANDVDVRATVEMLGAGELVALPTETVYGLGADARKPDAVRKIFFAKKRPVDHPLIVHISLPKKEYKDFEKKKGAVRAVLSLWAKDIPEEAILLGARFWPGPLTMILKKHDSVEREVTGGRPTIGIRIPAHEVFLDVLRLMGAGAGIAAPSANLHKQTSPTKATHVLEGLGGRISAVLDAGPCQFGLESTILDLTGSEFRIVRPGPITKKTLEDFLGARVCDSVAKIGGASGCMREHYQPPNTPAQLMTLEGIEKYLRYSEHAGKKFGLLHWSGHVSSPLIFSAKKLSDDPVVYGRDIFDAILELDKLGLRKILIQAPPTGDEWKAVNNRLGLATHGTNRV